MSKGAVLFVPWIST